MVTNRAPGNRHAAIIPTDPIPLPRSRAVLAEGHQLVPYHAVRTSSVENLWPSRTWNKRKCPEIASSGFAFAGLFRVGVGARRAGGPGLAQPLKNGAS